MKIIKNILKLFSKSPHSAGEHKTEQDRINLFNSEGSMQNAYNDEILPDPDMQFVAPI